MVEIYHKGKLVDKVNSIREASEFSGLSRSVVKDATKDGTVKRGYEFIQLDKGNRRKHTYTVTLLGDNGIPDVYICEGVERVCQVTGYSYNYVRRIMNNPTKKCRIIRHEK